MNRASIQSDSDHWNQSIYEQLYRIAERSLQQEAAGHSLQPTLLVNDAYMKLLQQRNLDREDRSAVMAAGATIIRRLLVDHARKRRSLRRGGKEGRGRSIHRTVAYCENQIDVIELNDAIDSLARHRARAAQIVELKFFGGLTCQEIGDQLDVSIRTVKSDWRFAKAWLYRQLSDEFDYVEA